MRGWFWKTLRRLFGPNEGTARRASDDPVDQQQRGENMPRVKPYIHTLRSLSHGEKPSSEGVQNTLAEASGALGHGLYSIGLMSAGDAIERQNYLSTPLKTSFIDLIFIDTYDRLYSAVGISAQASYTGFGGSGSASYSWTRNVSLDRTSVYLLCRKRIEIQALRIATPTLTNAALASYHADPATFLAQYGDVYVSSINSGGSVYLLFEISSTNTRELEQIAGRASGAAGPVSGSVDLFSRIEHVSGQQSFSMTAYQVGLQDYDPPIRGVDEEPLAYITRVFDYLTRFSERIYQQGGSDLSNEYSYYRTAGAINAPTLSTQRAALRACDEIRDNLDALNRSISLCLAHPELYIDNDTQALLKKRAEAKRIRQKVEDFATELFLDPIGTDLKSPVLRSTVPVPPTPKVLPPVSVKVTLRGPSSFMGRVDTEVSAGNGEWAELPRIPFPAGSWSNAPLAFGLAVSAPGLDLGANIFAYRGVLDSNQINSPVHIETFESRGGMIEHTSDLQLAFFGFKVQLTGSDARYFGIDISSVFVRWKDVKSDGRATEELIDIQGKSGEQIGTDHDQSLVFSKLMVSVFPSAY